MHRTLLPLLCVTALFATGCGSDLPETVPASGILTLDGQPLEGASITMLSKNGVTAIAKTDPSGNFSFKSVFGERTADGALVGQHSVGVAKTIAEGGDTGRIAGESDQDMVNRLAGSMTAPAKQTFIVPQKYNSPQNSNLSLDIPEGGSTTLKLELKSK